MLSLAIGALAIDETNSDILYAGTGEGNFALDSQYGIGILKTTDGAKTWKLSGEDTFVNSRFCRIAINSKNPSSIFAATTSLEDSSVASGIYQQHR